MRNRTIAATSAGVALLMLASLAPLPAGAEDTSPAPLIDLVSVENGTTDAFGGGDQLVVRVGHNAFGVVYGGEGDQAGFVTFYAAVVRTLGTADVYESASGRLVAEDVPLPVVTVVAQRMLGIVEFADLTGAGGIDGGPDGLFNFRPNLSTPETFDFNASEPLLKSLALDGTWGLTGFALVPQGDDAVVLEYSLTLANATYTNPGNPEWDGDGHVDAVAFHVRLLIERSSEQLFEVPHYDATVTRTRDGRELTSIMADGATAHNATVTRGTMKIDHEVVGWDPAPPQRGAPTRLLLLTAIPVLNGFSPAMAPWINELALHGERTTTATVERPEADPVEINEDTRPAGGFVRSSGLELRDAWRRTASLGFEPTVQVWGPDSQQPELGKAYFQVLGGAPIAERVNGLAVRGFLLIAGFSYPAAYRVYHDPQFLAEGVEFPERAILPGFQPAAVMAAQVGVIVASLAGAVLLSAYFLSSRARSNRKEERERLDALKERYQLPPGGGPP